MAEYPCDFHLARYQGPSTRAYLNLYREDTESKFKASLCPDCLADVMTAWLTRALHETDDGYWEIGEDDLALESTWKARSGPRRPLRRVG
jgi:hypothetical protein